MTCKETLLAFEVLKLLVSHKVVLQYIVRASATALLNACCSKESGLKCFFAKNPPVKQNPKTPANCLLGFLVCHTQFIVQLSE